MKGIQICSNEGHAHFQELQLRNEENTLTNFKIISLKNMWAISTKLCKTYPLVKGIQMCSNQRPCLFPKGDNCENGK